MRKALLFLFLLILHAIVNASEIYSSLTPTLDSLNGRVEEEDRLDEIAAAPKSKLDIGWGVKESIHKAFINKDTSLLKESLKEQSIECRLISPNQLSVEFFYDGDWHLYEWNNQNTYLLLDNQTVASSDDILLDPFLVIRTKHSRKTGTVDVLKSLTKFSCYNALDPAAYTGRMIDVEELPDLKTEQKKYFQSKKTVVIKNNSHEFVDTDPFFTIETDNDTCEELWWQIADKPFTDERSCALFGNFEGVQEDCGRIHFDLLTSTFFNSKQVYYLRVKAKHAGNWTGWSEEFSFVVDKAAAVQDPIFEPGDNEDSTIQWDSENPEGTRYLVFASNAIDFIPSIYCDKQVNSLADQEVLDEEHSHNLIGVTTEKSIKVDDQYAYYRIVAERNGTYSVPSPIVRFYKENVMLPRTVLQTDKRGFGTRVSYPAPYTNFNKNPEETLEAISRKMFGGKRVYRPEGVSDEVWEKVTPYLMPDNHPVKEKLDRVFSKSRATFSVKSLQEAGFSEIRCGHFSHATVAKHHRLKGYVIKIFRDEQKGRVDWQQWVKRAYGSKKVREYIAKHKYTNMMKAPRKWIYPLPQNPAPPEPCEKKNFILVAQDMRILKSKDNKAHWASRAISKSLLTAIFNIITDLGLSDTVQAFNMPFSIDGRICLIDLEHNFEWPIPYSVLTHYLSHSNASYWEELVRKQEKR